GQTLTPEEFEKFLAAQPDLSAKAWPRFVRFNDELPKTATNKILKRELIQSGATAAGGVLWQRVGRGTTYTLGDYRGAVMYSECMIWSTCRSPSGGVRPYSACNSGLVRTGSTAQPCSASQSAGLAFSASW